MDLGGITPGFHEGESTTIWRCPIAVYMEDGTKLEIVAIYADEGTFCIDVREKQVRED